MMELNLDATESTRQLEHRVSSNVDDLLAREGIVTDAQSRKRLLLETAGALASASARLSRYANGDYRPDFRSGRV